MMEKNTNIIALIYNMSMDFVNHIAMLFVLMGIVILFSLQIFISFYHIIDLFAYIMRHLFVFCYTVYFLLLSFFCFLLQYNFAS